MSKAYSTEELIQILADERRACLQGQRFKLTGTLSGNPLIDKFIKTDGVQKFTAYQDFKAAVHCYQRENQVSGIIWRDLKVKGKTLHYPTVDEQLIALPEDLESLKAAKSSVLTFWYEITADMDLYLSVNNTKDHQAIARADVDKIAQRTEWATLCKWENINTLEIILQLSWGKPEEAAYKWGWPMSGSEYIHAVIPGHRVIC